MLHYLYILHCTGFCSYLYFIILNCKTTLLKQQTLNNSEIFVKQSRKVLWDVHGSRHGIRVATENKQWTVLLKVFPSKIS